MSTSNKKFCRVSQTWLDVAEYERRKADYEERAFQRQMSQGELACPMIIRDDQRPVQSMTNGKFYDSKSELRKEYRRANVIEVGNDVPTKKPKIDWVAEKKKRHASIGRALSKAGFGAP